MIIANVIVIVIQILNVFIDLACALKALGQLLADSALTVGAWDGKRLSRWEKEKKRVSLVV